MILQTQYQIQTHVQMLLSDELYIMVVEFEPFSLSLSLMATLHLKPLNLSTGIQNSISGERRRPLLSPSIFLSTDPSNVDLHHLRTLLSSTNQSGHRFPDLLPDGSASRPDPKKLAAALRHSFVVVSAFARRNCPLFGDDPPADGERSLWWERLEETMPLTASNGRLVGFGRASSDGGLTAAIHDVAVLPSFQGLGIGKKIVQRIIRVLTNKGIYDVSALCSKEERKNRHAHVQHCLRMANGFGRNGYTTFASEV
ncbi:probable acetyltransferase TAP2 isoform X2 [Nymphaea colorata]|uniref:probable acetyltransferase TAP2 isoform X2 n=1 Tax=Nymphaea colorata TaxID=210225 RepID=UPI00129D29B3|nr:probable acetyltransferase TAP2 isoform X2 [Nymphaea colorata]